jgi:hypothetical protein
MKTKLPQMFKTKSKPPALVAPSSPVIHNALPKKVHQNLVVPPEIKKLFSATGSNVDVESVPAPSNDIEIPSLVDESDDEEENIDVVSEAKKEIKFSECLLLLTDVRDAEKLVHYSDKNLKSNELCKTMGVMLHKMELFNKGCAEQMQTYLNTIKQFESKLSPEQSHNIACKRKRIEDLLPRVAKKNKNF